MRIGPYEISLNKNRQEMTPAEQPERSDFREVGATGSTKWATLMGDDYNPVLRGQRALSIYDQMRRGDPKVRSSLRIIKTPLLAAEWYVEPASQDDADLYVAAFVEWAFNTTSRSFIQMLQEALLFLDFGYYVYEKVFTLDEYDGRPVVRWKKLAPRHPKTIIEWEFDDGGGVRRVRHNRKYPDGNDLVWLPIEDLLVFTLDEEAGNPEGMSILRSAYEDWYFKQNLYKIDAIQKERHGIGIPEVVYGPNATPNDKALAHEMARNLRTNEQAHVVRPASIEVGFLKPEGQLVNVLESAMHHDHQISLNVLAQFLDIGTTQSGARATSESHSAMFIKSIKYVADLMCGVFNMWAIPQLVNYNFSVKSFPKLKVRRLGEEADFRALSVAMRNFKESGAITPDPKLEEFLRDWMDLPKMTEEAMTRTVDDRLAVVPNAGQNDNSAREDKPADGA